MAKELKLIDGICYKIVDMPEKEDKMIEIGKADDIDSLIDLLTVLKEERENVPIYVENEVKNKELSEVYLYNIEDGFLISY